MAKGVIVTGCGGGLGGCTAEILLSRGVNVLGVDLDERGLGELAARTKDLPGTLITTRADVTEELSVRSFVQEAWERWEGLDGIFNNAGIEGVITDITRYPLEVFDRVMRVNVRAVFLGMKHAIPLLLKSGGGVILNTSSAGGILGWADLSAYCASKHAIIGLTRSVALELARKNVRANVLCPGPMDTRMIWAIGDTMAPGDHAKAKTILESTIPVGRLGSPKEVASAAAWLLLDAPAYLTGAVIPVDGAQTTGEGYSD